MNNKKRFAVATLVVVLTIVVLPLLFAVFSQVGKDMRDFFLNSIVFGFFVGLGPFAWCIYAICDERYEKDQSEKCPPK